MTFKHGDSVWVNDSYPFPMPIDRTGTVMGGCEDGYYNVKIQGSCYLMRASEIDVHRSLMVSVPIDGDAVAHPNHYTNSPAKCSNCGHSIECIDITQHQGFNLGNVTKYVWRCDLKRDAIEDLRKARQYLDFEIEKRERETA